MQQSLATTHDIMNGKIVGFTEIVWGIDKNTKDNGQF